jgi:hypothetical protein
MQQSHHDGLSNTAAFAEVANGFGPDTRAAKNPLADCLEVRTRLPRRATAKTVRNALLAQDWQTATIPWNGEWRWRGYPWSEGTIWRTWYNHLLPPNSVCWRPGSWKISKNQDKNTLNGPNERCPRAEFHAGVALCRVCRMKTQRPATVNPNISEAGQLGFVSKLRVPHLRAAARAIRFVVLHRRISNTGTLRSRVGFGRLAEGSFARSRAFGRLLRQSLDSCQLFAAHSCGVPHSEISAILKSALFEL